MPIYEYLCPDCQKEFEVEQKMKDLPVKICPECGKENVKRQISGGTSFQLLGGGWYREGYSSK
jgi:putative FmdB family regulatory protein